MQPYTSSSGQHPYGSSERRSLTGGGQKAGPIGTNFGFYFNNFFYVGRVINTFESAKGERLLLQFLDGVQGYMRRSLCTETE
ncbi:hypothetical protein GSI_09690 [Ganoderma sinense ZZ0214-1]|uniref:Uncharacterized protein n=1 Tax=Ganoderma sinense ZZ0214-1 TaxID=1077348 RepID=A0A2G8S2Z5_9APHY|nr:hypothetical protein GSI_09690 [Ganoderma sinense ZZ0214-1]